MKRYGRSIVNRTKRLALKTIASVPAESIPFIGVSVIVAGTVYELTQYCDQLDEIAELYSEFQVESGTADDVMQKVCKQL